MNRYALAADGHRWWWGSALAGTVAAGALSAIVVIPAAGQAVPVPTTRHEPSPTYVVLATAPVPAGSIGGNCFLYRAHWNVALDGPRPVCDWRVLLGAPERQHAVNLRPGLDWKA